MIKKHEFDAVIKKNPDMDAAFADELNEYKTSKGTVQFSYDKPMPYDLIREMVLFRVKEQANV